MQEVNQGEEEEIVPKCDVRCPKSHPGPSHTLSFRIGAKPCYECDNHSNLYYHCTTCNVDYQQGCSSHPENITHPYHLQHPLTNTRLNSESRISNFVQTQCPSIFDKCSWCGKEPDSRYYWIFCCSICSFCLCHRCSEKTPLLTIPNPKSHHHPLSFFPRPLLIPCDACGLVNASEASYACFQCNYMVHESCMDLPRVIKLTRHPHRLFFSPYLSPETVLCQICYRAVDSKYSHYSCNHEDCSYVVHSKCATHFEVWDGKELEWEPESEETEDVASFTKVGDDLIKYFCHDHYLKLEKYDGVRDANKQCEACVLPIDFRSFYSCTQCRYSLHEVCAGLPRKLDHVLHKHRLILDPTLQDDYGSMTCATCDRKSSGFIYKCVDDDCVNRYWHVDILCILIPPYFIHKSHQHPLFSSVSTPYERCRICDGGCWEARLHCTLCDFVLCYGCATIPTEILYKFDEHPLSLCYGESEKVGIYWCEVCEKEIDTNKWFYTCNKCCVTVHRECIFGSSAYMKSGSIFNRNGYTVKVISNNRTTRLICAICEDRCKYSVCYILPYEDDWFDKPLCSFDCLKGAMYRIFPLDM